MSKVFEIVQVDHESGWIEFFGDANDVVTMGEYGQVCYHGIYGQGHCYTVFLNDGVDAQSVLDEIDKVELV